MALTEYTAGGQLPIMPDGAVDPWSIAANVATRTDALILQSTSISLTGSGDYTPTLDDIRFGIIVFTGVPVAARNFIIPVNAATVPVNTPFKKTFVNNTAQIITVKYSTGTTQAVAANSQADLWGDGTDIHFISGATSTGAPVFAAQAVNTVFAGPSSGSPAVPTFRVLERADVVSAGLAITAAKTLTVTENLTLSGATGKSLTLTTSLTVNGGDGILAFPGAGATLTIPTGGGTAVVQNGAYLELAESAAPSTPTNAGRLFFDTSNRLSWKGENGFVRTFDGTANSADRIYVLPDAAGTVALLERAQTFTKLNTFQSDADATISLIAKANSATTSVSVLEIQNSSGTAYVKFGPPVGVGTTAWLQVTGTLPASPSGTLGGVSPGMYASITGAGTSATIPAAMLVNFAAGYTGARSHGLQFTNASATSGAQLFRGVTLFAGSGGGLFGCTGAGFATHGAGDNAGVYGYASAGLRNIGCVGDATLSQANDATAISVGALGVAQRLHASAVQIGLYGKLGNGLPAFVSAAGLFENGSTTDPMLVLSDGGVVKWTFGDNNVTTIGEGVNLVLGTTTGTKIGTGTTQKLGLYGVTPVVQAAALTQTYSTANRTHPNATQTAVATTAATNVAPYGYSTQAQADDIVTQLNAARNDILDLKKFVNSLTDDMQAIGISQ